MPPMRSNEPETNIIWNPREYDADQCRNWPIPVIEVCLYATRHPIVKNFYREFIPKSFRARHKSWILDKVTTPYMECLIWKRNLPFQTKSKNDKCSPVTFWTARSERNKWLLHPQCIDRSFHVRKWLIIFIEKNKGYIDTYNSDISIHPRQPQDEKF